MKMKLYIDSQYSSQQLSFVWDLKHHISQPLYIFNRARVLHLDRLKEGTWLLYLAGGSKTAPRILIMGARIFQAYDLPTGAYLLTNQFQLKCDIFNCHACQP